MRTSFRTVFISDTHLGFRGVRAEELSAFLKHIECERLYLVGDILDFWAIKQRWHWPATHNQVVRRILKQAKRGTQVIYIPGNHDDSLRQYVGLDLGGVRIAHQAAHRTADGRVLLITHGDEYDLVVQHSRLLSVLGTKAYDQLIALNRVVNTVRGVFGFGPWSFATAIKMKVKGACKYMSDFETSLLAEAKRRGMDGVVCGHVHQPLLREASVNDKGETTPLYANCGDWIERATALVEHADGRLEVINVLDFLAERGIEVKAASSEEVPLEPPVDFAGEFLAPFAAKGDAAEKTQGGQVVTEKQ